MEKEKLTITARKKGDEGYEALSGYSLEAEDIIISGTGTMEDPWIREVSVAAKEAFEGVIRIAMKVPGQSLRFFLPVCPFSTANTQMPAAAFPRKWQSRSCPL